MSAACGFWVGASPLTPGRAGLEGSKLVDELIKDRVTS